MGNACEKENKKEVEETTAKMESVDLIRKMKNFEEEKKRESGIPGVPMLHANDNGDDVVR